MITASANFTNALKANNRLWNLKVQVTRNTAGAVALDISDRVLSCEVTFDWEKRSGTASLELDNYDYSLSPVNQASLTNQVAGVFDPLLDSNHIIEIYEGLMTASGYEYIKKFTGLLGDEIDANTFPQTVQVTARDKSKLLQDTFIYQSKTYSPVAYPQLTIVEKVIQDMITQFLPSGNITMAVDYPTQYVLGRPDRPYTAKDINLWEAIQQISDVFNCQIMFDEAGTLRFKNIVRDLSTVTPVYAFNESELTKDSVSTTDSDVRNHIMLRVQGLDPIEIRNEDSIAKYGRRYMEVHRSLSYIITTAEQGYQLVNNMLKDLSYVVPIDKIEMPLNPLFQAGDIVSVTNTRLGTDPTYYSFRITNVRDSFTKDKKRTTLTLHGYVNFNPAASVAPKAPDGLTSQMSTRTIQNYTNSGWSGASKTTYYPLLNWNAVTQDVNNAAVSNSFGGYTVYRKGPSDTQFFAIASVKSYIAPLNLVVNYLYDYTAQSGTNQYKLVAINKFGKVSAESAVISVSVPVTTYT